MLPTATLSVTGTQANQYRLLFNDTTLTASATPATVNVGLGVSLILGSQSGGGFTNTNKPINAGAGTLLFSGNQSFTAPATIAAAATQVVVPTVNSITNPLGVGATIALGANSTLTFTPVVSPSVPLSTANYTTGGVTARYYNLAGLNS